MSKRIKGSEVEIPEVEIEETRHTNLEVQRRGASERPSPTVYGKEREGEREREKRGREREREKRENASTVSVRKKGGM